MATPSSERTTLRRGAQRAEYDRAAQLAILDAGMVAHVGVGTTRGPLVLPMAYGRTDDHVLLHGAARNGLLREAIGADVCVTVTIVDGLVIARTPFHNSMNYRSVVIRGVTEEIADPDDKREALKLISDHVVANWDTRRPPTDAEIRRTLILRVPLAEMSGKVRAGDPIDEEDDLGGPYWAGHVPIDAAWGAPVGDPQLGSDTAAPKAIADLRDRPVH